eukprot:SAG31_NODE_3895_length_3773_cov_21.681818_5_plen_119_part_00
MVHHSSGFIWLFSGGTYETPKRDERKFCNDVWRSQDGVSWELVLEAAPWSARQYAEVAVWDDRLWLLEGFGVESTKSLIVSVAEFKKSGARNRSDCWCSIDGIHWEEVVGSPVCTIDF